MPKSRFHGANKIGQDGGIQPIGFVSPACTLSVLFDSSRIEQAYPMALSMQPQRKRLAVGSGGFQACPNLGRVLLLKNASKLSKALGIVGKAKAHFAPLDS